MKTKTMKAIEVAKYGSVDNLASRDVSRPGALPEWTFLFTKACSVNPIDTKVCKGTHDDAPDCYKFVPKHFHIIGFDGAGTVLEVGPQSTNVKPGDDVFYASSTTRQGSAAEYLLVENVCVPRSQSRLTFWKPLLWV
ncbi:hypothetical protein EAE96_011287 [Botrytis aclada]|nr:hypothetical protein EAE96_011287 [Botrytis aclada]